MDEKSIWDQLLLSLEEKIDPRSFQTWFKNTEFLSFKDKTLLIKVQTKFASDFLNKNYTSLISEISNDIFKVKYNIRFTQNDLLQKETQVEKFRTNTNPEKPRLNQKYTFEEFIVGKSNNFAHSASMAVAESPGNIYNPLFIYGESGMGKTHLMQAIGNFVLKEMSNKKVYYTSSEAFTNEMIDALRSNSMPKFRNKYRNIDVLLIDDIHFMAKKEGTQEEFFHTFNALYDSKKQIVMTSDRPPKDIADLEKRLVTRFEWGLLADLKTPDFETRVAILRKKAESDSIQLQDDVMEFIAEHIYNNIRTLEGSLIRISAYASYNKINTVDVTRKIAGEVLSDMISDKIQDINMDLILKKICAHFKITAYQLLDKTRKKNIAFPRQIAMYLSNLLIPQLSLKEIALYYKRKDHTTVLHANKTVEKKFKEDNDFRIEIESLIKEIKQ